MRYLLQEPPHYDPTQSYPLWVALHGAFAHAEQGIELFGVLAQEQHAFLLAPQATRLCGEGFCWSFAHDTAQISELLKQLGQCYQWDQKRWSVLGYSMGCTIGCWLLAKNPGKFAFFAALAMGSAFEPWEHDDGGIPEVELQQTTSTTRIFLSVDQHDPYGCTSYYEANLARFRQLGFGVATFQPDQNTHDVTEEMKRQIAQHLPE